MTRQLVKARKDDLDDALEALNDFCYTTPETSLQMLTHAGWRRNDQDLGKHLLVKEGQTILGIVGIYPQEVMIGRHKLACATIGNLGVRQEYQAQGLEQQLLVEALSELASEHIQVARMEGNRNLCNQHGFETAGRIIHVQLHSQNISPEHTGKVHFMPIQPTDQHALNVAQLLYAQNFLHVNRGDSRRFFDRLDAFDMSPSLALDEHQAPIGYVVASPDGHIVAEHNACSPQWQHQMLQDWLLTNHLEHIELTVSPWNRDLIRLLTNHAETWHLAPATRLQIRDWLALAQALLDAKQALTPLPQGKCLLHILGYGTLAFVNDTVALSEEQPMIMLDRLAATRFLCGSLPVESVCDLPPSCRDYAKALFPLPFTWCNQDRN